jgi:hypothetical protein
MIHRCPGRWLIPAEFSVAAERRLIIIHPTNAFMNEWNIQSRAHACQTCGHDFIERQTYYTVLFDEKKEFVRQDICEGCWQKQFGHGSVDKKGFVSRWQGVYEVPPAVSRDPIQKDTAETLLRKVVESGDPKYAAASFILAVILERKRLLKVKEQLVHEGRRTFIYEHPKTGDVFTIPDPNLQLNQLEQVQRDVAMLMQEGLPTTEGIPGAAPSLVGDFDRSNEHSSAAEPPTMIEAATAPSPD